MDSWKEMSVACFRSAQSLQKTLHWRSSVSRSYYAAYSAIAGKLEGRVTYPSGRKNPPHDVLPQLIVSHLTSLSMTKRRRMSSTMVRMFENRVDADYRPHRIVNKHTASWAAMNASDILRSLGVLT